MSTRFKFTIAAILIGYILLISILLFPYEVGFKKPRFKPGDCVAELNDFGDVTTSYKILAVSKKRYKYKTFNLQSAGYYRYGYEHATVFWLVDDYGSLVECPKIED